MIAADISELEKLSFIIAGLASDTDETLNLLRRTLSEMENDAEFQLQVQGVEACEHISFSIDKINRVNDMLQSLKHVLSLVPSEYRENEEKHKNAISRMTERIKKIGTGFAAVASSSQITPVEQSNENIRQNDIQKLVSDSAEEMQMVNIASLTQTIKDEYGIENVEKSKDI